MSEITPPKPRGRQPKRVDGKARREQILAATLRIIARDGVRAVRHRAVAKESGVPLSATTYYFKDILELISEAFYDFAEKGAQETGHMTQAVAAALARFSDGSQSLNDRELLRNTVLITLLNHIDQQVKNRERRLIENSFRLEALHHEAIRDAQTKSQAATLKPAKALLEMIGSPSPEADAELVYSTVLYLEYQRILAGDTPTSKEHCAMVLRRLLSVLI